jgi:hypothetical protein
MSKSYKHPLVILAAVIVQQAAGALWYSPLLFQAAWFAGQGKLAKDVDMSNPLPFIASILGSLLATGVISIFLEAKKVNCPIGGSFMSGMLALGLPIPAVVVHELFLGFGPGVTAIDAGGTLLGLMLCGFVLGLARAKVLGTNTATAQAAANS